MERGSLELASCNCSAMSVSISRDASCWRRRRNAMIIIHAAETADQSREFSVHYIRVYSAVSFIFGRKLNSVLFKTFQTTRYPVMDINLQI